MAHERVVDAQTKIVAGAALAAALGGVAPMVGPQGLHALSAGRVSRDILDVVNAIDARARVIGTVTTEMMERVDAVGAARQVAAAVGVATEEQRPARA